MVGLLVLYFDIFNYESYIFVEVGSNLCQILKTPKKLTKRFKFLPKWKTLTKSNLTTH